MDLFTRICTAIAGLVLAGSCEVQVHQGPFYPLRGDMRTSSVHQVWPLSSPLQFIPSLSPHRATHLATFAPLTTRSTSKEQSALEKTWVCFDLLMSLYRTRAWSLELWISSKWLVLGDVICTEATNQRLMPKVRASASMTIDDKPLMKTKNHALMPETEIPQTH